MEVKSVTIRKPSDCYGANGKSTKVFLFVIFNIFLKFIKRKIWWIWLFVLKSDSLPGGATSTITENIFTNIKMYRDFRYVLIIIKNLSYTKQIYL